MDGGQAAWPAACITSPVPVKTTGQRSAHKPSITVTVTATASPVACPGLCQGRSPIHDFPILLSNTSSRKTRCATQECPPSSVLEDLPLQPLSALSAYMPAPLPGTPYCSLPSSDFLVSLGSALLGNPPQLSVSLPGLQVLPLSFWHTCGLLHPGSALLPVLGIGQVPSRQRGCKDCYHVIAPGLPIGAHRHI